MRPKIYDCFPFFNELELLKIRFAELYDIVDKFVITEARQTHSGKYKPLYLRENLHLFAEYQDKIVLHTVDFDANCTDAWARERAQRDGAFDALKNILHQDDFVIISDCDEIPSINSIINYVNDATDNVGILQQDRYMYYFNNKLQATDEPQCNSRIVTAKAILSNNLMPCTIRYCDKYNLYPSYVIENGGWHFTFMGGVEKVIEKIKSFAHTEYDVQNKTDPNIVASNMARNIDVYNCHSRWRLVDIDESFPQLIQQNKQKYIDTGYIKNKTRIFDCFIFNDELDILEIRLHELDEVVDVFVIVEARRTHQNAEKPLYYELNKSRFAKFASKIRHIIKDEFPNLDGDPRQYWLREVHQRNAIVQALGDCKDDDVIIISDVDEIPSASAIHVVDRTFCFSQKMFYYNFSCYSDERWCKAKILPYKILRDEFALKPQELRNFECDAIENGGWHCSYFGGLEAAYKKLHEFSHAEFSNISKEKMLDAISNNYLYYNGKKLQANNDMNDLPRRCITNSNQYQSLFAQKTIYEKLKEIDEPSFSEVFHVDVYGMKREDYEGTTVIDVGANIGCYAQRAIDFGAKTVHCFEPESRNFAILSNLFSTHENIHIYNFAITDTNVKFVEMSAAGAIANMYGVGETASIKTRAMAFDELMTLIDCKNLILKLDCEGAEFDIILHSQSKSFKNINIVCVEIHDNLHPIYINKSQSILARLDELGFETAYKAPQIGFWHSDGSFAPAPIYCYMLKRKKI